MPEIVTRERDPAAFNALIAANVDPRLARVYAARGVSAPCDLDHGLPSLLAPTQLGSVKDAAKLLADAIESGKRLLIEPTMTRTARRLAPSACAH